MTKYISFLYVQKNYPNNFSKNASNVEIKESLYVNFRIYYSKLMNILLNIIYNNYENLKTFQPF